MTVVRMVDELGTLAPVVRIVRINGETRRVETMRFVPLRTYESTGEFVDDAVFAQDDALALDDGEAPLGTYPSDGDVLCPGCGAREIYCPCTQDAARGEESE